MVGLARMAVFSAGCLLLAACGGGGGGGGGAPAPTGTGGGTTGGGGGTTTQTGFPNTFEASAQFQNICAAPRASDQQGTSEDENNWLRSWSNELYLWYDEIEDQDPAAFDTPEYFDLMKTMALTASGAPKDKFHFTIPTEEWLALSQSGVASGYGAEFRLIRSAPPRDVVVAFTYPGTAATGAGLVRGTRLLEVDGVDVVNGSDIDTLNAGLFPSGPGESHTFLVQDPGSTTSRSVTLVSAEISEDPVQFEQVISTPAGPVGYLFFSSHIAPAEQDLVNAMANFRDAAVVDLVLDLRYNGGGFLDIANELAFMVAGSSVSGEVFDTLEFSDKHPTINPVTGATLTPTVFHETTQGFSVGSGQPLPQLNLRRVFVLSTDRTCSASEAIINGLRGVNIEVVLIGGTTCGKPYGFYDFDNCGTTYFSIQFRGINAQGFGDYADGFSPEVGAVVQGTSIPGCFVEDDFSRQLGDTSEAQLAAALNYIDTESCPASSSSIAQPFTRAVESSGPAIAPPWRPGTVLRR